MEYFVFLPGIMGSHLSVPGDAKDHAGEEVWPPTPIEVMFTGYQRFEQLMLPRLEAPRIIGSVAKVCNFYASVLADLDHVAWERTNDPKLEDATVVRFPYDWRLDLCDVAKDLSARLSQVLDDDPQARFTLIAHSMGGLLARYLLEAPAFTDLPWHDAARLVRLICIATPHDGAPLALDRILGNDATLGISGEQFALFAAEPGFPSGYQLVPGEDAGFVRDETGGVAGSATVNPFGKDFVDTFRLEPRNIAANRALRAGLDLARRPCDYVFFAGTGQKTRTGMRRTGASAEAIIDETGGDETVPSFSAATHRVPTRFVNATHVGILANLRMRRALYELLGAPRDVRPVADTGQASGRAPVEDISVPTEPVPANPEEEGDAKSRVRLTINLRDRSGQFRDRLRFEPVAVGDGEAGERLAGGRREEHAIRYEGPELDSLSVSVPAPRRAGVYTVGFVDAATDNPVPPRIMVTRRA